MAKFRVGLGVCGGIAVYKAVEVMRLLQKAGCEVSVAMTRHATEFVRPLTFRALTGGHVIVDDYDPQNPDPIAHVNFSQNIDLFLIVPATANTIAKFANGIADDFLSSTYLACTAPVMIAPAMNTTMWEQPATQRNIGQLKADGVRFVEPIAGELACKTVGTGKLEDVENIVEQAMELLNSRFQILEDGFPIPDEEIRSPEGEIQNSEDKHQAPETEGPTEDEFQISDSKSETTENESQIPENEFQIPDTRSQYVEAEFQIPNSTFQNAEEGVGIAVEANMESGIWNQPIPPESGIWNRDSEDLVGEHFLITVGGTREAIDPVRFISNHSSGKMGFAVAEAAAARGAKVTVVAGVTSVEPPAGVHVVKGISAQEMFDAVMRELPRATVFVGAAAVADYAPANAADAKIKKEGRDTLTLELKKTPDILSEVSKRRKEGQLVVGFAAETNDVVTYARIKMGKKNLDMVVANDVSQSGAGFDSDTNIATVISRLGTLDLPLMPKRQMADRILDEIVKLGNS
jgi:phosphopantothenoylcysteine decarboxylase / phosphopantothenate---cysteine ligase